MNYGIPYAYYSSQTQFNYGPVYALDAHKREYFRIKSGLGDPTLSMADYELEFYRQNSGLPSTATDSQHFDAYYDNLTLPDPTWVNALRADAVTARGIVNLATNPSFEAAGATVEVRRNHFPDPHMLLNTSVGWNSAVSSGVVVTNNAVTTSEGNPGRRITITDVGTTGIWALYGGRNSVAAGMPSGVTGERWLIGMRASASAPTIVSFGLGYGTGSTWWSPVALNVGTSPTTHWVEFTVPSAANNAPLNLRVAQTSESIQTLGVSGWVELSQPVFTKPWANPVYFDGSSASPDTDLTPAWVGPVAASSSVLNGSRAATWPVSMQNCVAILSTKWAVSGTKSLRVIPTDDSANNSTPYSTLSALGLEIGKTYTVLATLRLEAPLTGPFNAASRTLSLNTGGISAQAPNEAGVHQLRITFNYDGTINHPGSTLRFYHGVAAGGGDAWWDNFMIVEGNYSGTYFDGDSHGAIWLGAEHASQSATYPEFVN